MTPPHTHLRPKTLTPFLLLLKCTFLLEAALFFIWLHQKIFEMDFLKVPELKILNVIEENLKFKKSQIAAFKRSMAMFGLGQALN